MAAREVQPIGHVTVSNGQRCRFTQTIDSTARHFHNRLTSITSTMVFDSPTCAPNNAATQKAINDVISVWYSHDDANFATARAEMYPDARFQDRGLCIQSRTYPGIGIAIEYFGKAYITRVRHAQSGMNCTGQPLGASG